MLPADKNRGFINDLDDGMPFWPDGQTDDCLYMLRTVTEMRELVKRTGSPKQKKLVELLDNPKVHERDYVMIVVDKGVYPATNRTSVSCYIASAG